MSPGNAIHALTFICEALTEAQMTAYFSARPLLCEGFVGGSASVNDWEEVPWADRGVQHYPWTQPTMQVLKSYNYTLGYASLLAAGDWHSKTCASL